MRSISNPPLLLLVALCLFLACSARQRDGKVSRAPYDPASESFDPFAYPGDDEVVTTESQQESTETADSSLYYLEIVTESQYPDQVFRVQLFASQNYYQAQEELEIAAEVFDDGIQINYAVPYYRVELGDFRSEDEANRLLRRARSLGYIQSWIVTESVDSLFWIELEADTLMIDSPPPAGGATQQ